MKIQNPTTNTLDIDATPPTNTKTRTRPAAYLTTAAIPPSGICPLLLLQLPANLAFITTLPTCTYRDCAIARPHAYQWKGDGAGTRGCRRSTSWCRSWCLHRSWCHGSQCPGGLPATLQISVKAFVNTLMYHHHSLLCTPPRSYTLQRSVRASSTPPHPLISPSAVQKSVRAFVHTPQHRIGGTLWHEYCHTRTWYAETCRPKKCVPMLIFSPHLTRRGRNMHVTWYFPRTFGERQG
jgi:hypothetical protein